MHFTNKFLLYSHVAITSAQYLGFNSGATLDDTKVKQQSDFEQEFKTAQALSGAPGKFNSVRLYTNVQGGTKDTPISAFPAAIATNTSMLLGIWTSGTKSIDNELSALHAAIKQYGNKFTDLVVGISVGSEDLYRDSEAGILNKAGIGNGPKEIVAFINQVRSSVANTPLSSAPIGHVDTWTAWDNGTNAAVVKACDWIGTDSYPYYEKEKPNAISEARNLFETSYNKVINAAGGKPVWVTETGWPSTGPLVGSAEATVDNAQEYWQQIGCRKLFGKVNTWWYTLRDSNPANKEKFAITENLSTTPRFNLTCPVFKDEPTSTQSSIPSSTATSTSNNTSSNASNSETNGVPNNNTSTAADNKSEGPLVMSTMTTAYASIFVVLLCFINL